jgi:AGCS family alanine or glycine:cation symporter
METIHRAMLAINDVVWGVPMLVLILGTGLYLTIGLGGMSIYRIPFSLRLMMRGRRGSGAGEVSPYNALMTSLSATIGIGNIVGVATAIAAGGPGALFWMWCTALVGSATKYAEAVLAVHYRERIADGSYAGGPMYYIRNGLGPRWRWLAFAFAVFGALAGFGIGNTVQANSVADALAGTFAVPHWLSAVVMLVLTALVILGGVQRIAKVSGWLVPVMALIYMACGLVILVLHWEGVPAALALVFSDAFTGTAATGGFAGAAVAMAIRYGVARGIFSNEAGMGSAPIAHAAAQTDSAVRQGLIGSLGTFIDTILVCTVTGLAIIVTGVWQSGATGAMLSSQAFGAGMPGGQWMVAISLVLFAYSTILGWAYYSERCVVYLVGPRGVWPFRWLWVAAVPLGALAKLEFVWLLADNLNALMALPNLVALLLLSPVVFRLTREQLPAILIQERLNIRAAPES